MNARLKILVLINITLCLILSYILIYSHRGRAISFGKPINTTADNAKLIQLEKTKTATFLAVGDIMLSRNVAGTVTRAHDTLLPFRKLDALLNSTDFNFGNLESPFSGSDYFNPTGSMVFNAPRTMIEGLVVNNFQVLNLANNHALDQGVSGLTYTQTYLQEHGIVTLGVGDNLDKAWQGKIIETSGIKINFLGVSYASVNDNGKTHNPYIARIEDLKRLTTTIADLKNKADFVVVTMHAGTEYTRKPNAAQINFAHAAIDAGADIVIGAHPHWIQTTEKYKNKFIFYSLGNFIFDQEWSKDTKEGLTLKVTIENNAEGTKIKQVKLIPIIIENYCCPREATPEEAKTILNKIGITDKWILKTEN